jgi:hypothetical protein
MADEADQVTETTFTPPPTPGPLASPWPFWPFNPPSSSTPNPEPVAPVEEQAPKPKE